MFRQLTARQSITANAVGIYINTNTSNYFDEGTPYQYDVKGKTASALTEVIYENRLKPFILSAGLNHRYKYTKNDYIGDASAMTEMSQHNVYAFSEIQGTLKDIRYVLGLGASYIHYDQNKHNYNIWTFCPIVMLSYNFLYGMNLRYSFELEDRASRIAMINDATIQTNSMEMTVGNPDLNQVAILTNYYDYRTIANDGAPILTDSIAIATNQIWRIMYAHQMTDSFTLR